MAEALDKATVEIGGNVNPLKGAIQGIPGLFKSIGSALGSIDIGNFLGEAIDDAKAAQEAYSKLNAVVKSTGTQKITFGGKEIIRATTDELTNFADQMEKTTRFEAETTMNAQTMLMTFTRIGRDVMPGATEAALDMATVLGSDASGAAMMLGKALNDPIAGIGALRKVGVTLSAQQEQSIKRFMAQGKIAEAQSVILKELQTEFGGAAKAAGETLAGKMDILTNKFGSVKESIGTALLPVLDIGVQLLGSVADALSGVDPGLTTLGVLAAAAATGLGPLVGIFGGLLAPIGGITVAIGGLALAWDTNFAGIRDIAANALKAVGPALDQLKSGVSKFFDVFNQDVDYSKLDPAQMEMAQAGELDGIGKKLSIGERLGKALAAAAPDILKGLGELGSAILAQIPTVLGAMVTGIAGEIIKGINAAFGTNFNWEESKKKLQTVFETDIPLIFSAVFGPGGKVDQALQPLRDIWNGLFGDEDTSLKNQLGNAMEASAAWFNEKFVIPVQGYIDTARGYIQTVIDKIGEIGGAFTAAFSGVAKIIVTPFADAVEWIGKLLMKAGELGGVFSSLKDTGAGLVTAANNMRGNDGGSDAWDGQSFHAFGGDFEAGKPMRVGEFGPEVIVPGFSGTVMPNSMVNDLGSNGGGGINIQNLTVVLPNANDANAILRGVQQAAKKQGRPITRGNNYGMAGAQ